MEKEMARELAESNPELSYREIRSALEERGVRASHESIRKWTFDIRGRRQGDKMNSKRLLNRRLVKRVFEMYPDVSLREAERLVREMGGDASRGTIRLIRKE